MKPDLSFFFSFLVINFCVLWKKLLTTRIHEYVLPYFHQKLYGFSCYVEICCLFQNKFLHKVRARSKFVDPSFLPFVFSPYEHTPNPATLIERIYLQPIGFTSKSLVKIQITVQEWDYIWNIFYYVSTIY